jgi:hypothetical protein
VSTPHACSCLSSLLPLTWLRGLTGGGAVTWVSWAALVPVVAPGGPGAVPSCCASGSLAGWARCLRSCCQNCSACRHSSHIKNSFVRDKNMQGKERMPGQLHRKQIGMQGRLDWRQLHAKGGRREHRDIVVKEQLSGCKGPTVRGLP